MRFALLILVFAVSTVYPMDCGIDGGCNGQPDGVRNESSGEVRYGEAEEVRNGSAEGRNQILWIDSAVLQPRVRLGNNTQILKIIISH